MTNIKHFFSLLFSLFVLFSLIGFVIFLLLLYYYGFDLPDHQRLKNYKPSLTTRFYANDGQLFGEYALEKRVFLPMASTPKKICEAFLSAEDKNFYSHCGLDFMGITRALLKNIKSMLTQNNRRPEGGSTITQQVARNILIQDIAYERSLSRKIKEAILAIRIEFALTKEQILEIYLNEIFLGKKSYGIAAASLNYFNKSVDELSLSEMAFLASLPKAPSYYQPNVRPDKVHKRKNWVLTRMYNNGYISKEDLKQSKEEKIILNKREYNFFTHTKFFSNQVQKEVINNFGKTGLYKDGLVVRTTLDPFLQVNAFSALREGLIEYDRRHGWRGAFTSISKTKLNFWQKELNKIKEKQSENSWHMAVVLNVEDEIIIIGLKNGKVGKINLKSLKWARKFIHSKKRGANVTSCRDVLNIGDVIYVSLVKSKKEEYELQQIPTISGAIIVMDRFTGKVYSLIGGFDFNYNQFCRATQALRQIGSTFKPFVYLKALEEGVQPNTLIDDSPFVLDLGPDIGLWKPKNYSKKFDGMTTLRTALEKSRNIVSIRLVSDYITLDQVSEIALRFNLYDYFPSYFSMVLGAGETTLLKLVTAYSMIGNGGEFVEPIFIERIQNRYGKTVFFDHQLICDQCQETKNLSQKELPVISRKARFVAKPEHAYQVISMLEGAVIRGTGRKAAVKGYHIAGKSGSTNNFSDAFFVGFVDNLTVGVFVGFDDMQSIGEYSATVASPIFAKFVKLSEKVLDKKPFDIPSGIKFLRINLKTGKPATKMEKGTIIECFTEDAKPFAKHKDISRNTQDYGGIY